MIKKAKNKIFYTAIIILTIFTTGCPEAILTAELAAEFNRSSSHEITAFSFAASDNTALLSDVAAVINTETSAITAEVPYGTDVTSLVATFTATGEVITVGSAVQKSGETANDYSSPVSYIVTAEDESYAVYTVTVSWGAASRAAVENAGFTTAADIGDAADIFFPDSNTSLRMIYASDGTSTTVPTDADDQGSYILESNFFIGETEVTNKAAAAILQWAYNNGKLSDTVGDHNGLNATTVKYGTRELFELDASDNCRIVYDEAGTFGIDSGYENHPVTHISWYGAIMLCNWLTEMRDGTTDNIVYTEITDSWVQDDTLCYDSRTGYRLADDLEREYIARYRGSDSTNTVAGYTGPYFTKGDSASGATANSTDKNATALVAVYDYSGNRTDEEEVKSLGISSANALGLYDVSGNVDEWVWGDGPEHYGVTGGSWKTTTGYHFQLRPSDISFGGSPNNMYNHQGFRFARTGD